MTALAVYQNQAKYGAQAQLNRQDTTGRLSRFMPDDVVSQTPQAGGLMNQRVVKEIDCIA